MQFLCAFLCTVMGCFPGTHCSTGCEDYFNCDSCNAHHCCCPSGALLPSVVIVSHISFTIYNIPNLPSHFYLLSLKQLFAPLNLPGGIKLTAETIKVHIVDLQNSKGKQKTKSGEKENATHHNLYHKKPKEVYPARSLALPSNGDINQIIIKFKKSSEV